MWQIVESSVSVRQVVRLSSYHARNSRPWSQVDRVSLLPELQQFHTIIMLFLYVLTVSRLVFSCVFSFCVVVVWFVLLVVFISCGVRLVFVLVWGVEFAAASLAWPSTG